MIKWVERVLSRGGKSRESGLNDEMEKKPERKAALKRAKSVISTLELRFYIFKKVLTDFLGHPEDDLFTLK